MSLNAPKGEKKQRPIAPIGTHAATCFLIADLGQHTKTFGKESKVVSLVYFGWEFPNLPPQVFDEAKGPQPLAIFQEYTTSIHEKAKLYQMLNGWRGVPPQDLAKELPVFLGQSCLISVVHNPDKTTPGITYANIANGGASVMRLPQGMQVAPAKNQKVFFNLDTYTHAQFLTLPEWLQKKIKACHEWPQIIAKHGAPPEPQQQQFQQPNTQFQNQGFNQTQQSTGFQQQPVQNQFQQPVQNQGAQFGGEIIKGNPFDQQAPF